MKQMRNSEASRTEVQLMASLSGPNLVRYHTAWLQEGHLMMAMELCERSLRKAGGHLDEPLFLKIMLHACEGLRCLHEKDVVHLDLKPSNILEAASGDFKVGDLGLARAIKLIGTEIPEGDQRYLSKELMCQNQTRFKTNLDLKKADIFALGATAYQLIEGVKLPLNGQTWHDLREGRIVFSKKYSEATLAMVRDMMNPEPKHRPSV